MTSFKRDAQRVRRRLEKPRRDTLEHDSQRVVRRHGVPAAVDGHGGVGVVGREEEPERVPRGGHVRIVERALGIRRRIARGEQEPVAIAERDIEPFGQVEHHLATRSRPPGLDEAEVTGGHGRVERELELADPSPLAPGAQQLADARGLWEDGHHPNLAAIRCREELRDPGGEDVEIRGAMRASIGLGSTAADVDALLAGLGALRSVLG